jgi:hypothetical protein
MTIFFCNKLHDCPSASPGFTLIPSKALIWRLCKLLRRKFSFEYKMCSVQWQLPATVDCMNMPLRLCYWNKQKLLRGYKRDIYRKYYTVLLKYLVLNKKGTEELSCHYRAGVLNIFESYGRIHPCYRLAGHQVSNEGNFIETLRQFRCALRTILLLQTGSRVTQ